MADTQSLLQTPESSSNRGGPSSQRQDSESDKDSESSFESCSSSFVDESKQTNSNAPSNRQSFARFRSSIQFDASNVLALRSLREAVSGSNIPWLTYNAHSSCY